MDKGWMKFSRLSPEYEAGLQQFLDYAIDKFGDHGLIQCPCKKCMGGPWLPRQDVNDHLIIHGFKAGYEICWDQHGESRPQEGNQPEGGVEQMLHDIFPFVGHNDGASTSTSDPVIGRMTNSEDVEKVRKLMDDANVPLYTGCDKMAKLEFLIRLYHAKCSNGFSNNGVNCILELLGDILPDDARIPKNNYEASKIIEQLGFTYTKIHACPNDCMLYWEGDVNRNECTRCGVSRWKQNKDGTLTRVPQKLMWHFPLIPRLQKLFMSAKTSKDMRWHEEDRTKDDTLRHPADGEAWQKFNELHPDFAQEIRNVRLGLSCDGFNPFKHMNTAHSVWPVFIHVYNLPPWMCMKKSFAFMTVLIPGPIEAGNDIDVYLQPLIAELKQLWSIQGVPTFDALLNESFSMRAALLWTINDFPAYALMSGWSTKGELACPVCGRNTRSRRLTHRRSFSYMGHRRFLRRNHPYRRDARSFDGTVEEGEAPGRMSGSEVLQELDGLSVEFGKGDPIGGKKRKRRSKEDDTHFNWRKKSIFFDLPYWETNLLRHCLDVMHIEKNVCELLLATILNIKDKTKDDLNSRLDLKEWGIRRSLHPEPAGGEQWRLPHACYVMNASERSRFLRVLENIKVPDGYSSNISKRVNSKDVKLGGLKTHDYHVLMQELIPIAIRRVLPKNVRMAVIRLCNFYRDICAKRLLKKDVKEMKARAVTILCDLEKIFPPSFFTVMMHLTVHLAGEVALGGPVFCRWMYPTERNIQTLKSYVRNMNRPEGSIAERYLGQECMDFCTMYLNKLETRRNRPMRNQDDQYEPIEPAFESIPQPGGLPTSYRLTDLSIDERDKAHRYVLFNCDVIEPYVSKHKEVIRVKYGALSMREKEKMHSNEFPEWFKDHVWRLPLSDVSPEVRALSMGPNRTVREYKQIVINGYRFNIHSRSVNMATQNSGVMLSATTGCYASSRDSQPRTEDLNYYGTVEKIVLLDYYSKGRIALMKCEWFDTLSQSGMKTDECGFTLVNMQRHLRTEEPYILASQASQVFYVSDPLEPQWGVVVKMVPRHIFDDTEVDDDVGPCMQSAPLGQNLPGTVEVPDTFVRSDGDVHIVDATRR